MAVIILLALGLFPNAVNEILIVRGRNDIAIVTPCMCFPLLGTNR
jgi:hypothetical protein